MPKKLIGKKSKVQSILEKLENSLKVIDNPQAKAKILLKLAFLYEVFKNNPEKANGLINEVLILASSGTGAMEGAVSNILSEGDEVLVIRGGKFGERWAEICDVYGIKTTNVDVEWGKAVDPQLIARYLERNPAIRAVYTTYSETSTGVLTDIKAIADIVRNYDNTIIVVDAM